MKKIGILTFHRSINNGAVIQSYSLSKKLQQDFPDYRVEIINYNSKVAENQYDYTVRKYLKSRTLLTVLKKAAYLFLNPQKIKTQNQRTTVFRSCLNKLPLSEQFMISDDLESLFTYINEQYDALIVGSDAVWNYNLRGFPNAYFPDKRVNRPKLSYAASCYGMDFLKASNEDRERIKCCLADFDYIGVRDFATENFVKWSGCSKSVYHNCDPTVFLDVDDLPIDFEHLKEKLVKRGFNFDKPTIGIMGNGKMYDMVCRIFGKEYQIVALYEYISGADVNLYDLEPYEWAYVFRYFKVTFTTYFHGTLLSLRNGVPVICVALNTDFAKIHIPKTQDLLTRLGFSGWYFQTDYSLVNIDLIEKKQLN